MSVRCYSLTHRPVSIFPHKACQNTPIRPTGIRPVRTSSANSHSSDIPLNSMSAVVLIVSVLASCLPVAHTASVSRTVQATVSALQRKPSSYGVPVVPGKVNDVFIPFAAPSNTPLELEVDLDTLLQQHGIYRYRCLASLNFHDACNPALALYVARLTSCQLLCHRYLPWLPSTQPSQVDINVEVEPGVNMSSLAIRVNSGFSSTVVNIDSSKMAHSTANDGYVFQLAFLVAGTLTPTQYRFSLASPAVSPTVCDTSQSQ